MDIKRDVKRDVNRDQVKQDRTHILLDLKFVQWEEFKGNAEDLSLFKHFAANFQHVDHMLGLLVVVTRLVSCHQCCSLFSGADRSAYVSSSARKCDLIIAVVTVE